MGIKQKANSAFGRIAEQDIDIKVLFSGVAASPDEGKTLPFYADCRTPIKIEADDRILYSIRNPFFPLNFQVISGGKQTVLGLNSNYLAYKDENW